MSGISSGVLATIALACRQPLEDRVARRLFIEMEGLWIECGSESLDLFHANPQATGSEGLAHGEVFGVSPAHFDPLSPVRRFVSPGDAKSACWGWPVSLTIVSRTADEKAFRAPSSLKNVFLNDLGSSSCTPACNRPLLQMLPGALPFARYSTDDRWLVPHFEKMLYDNAQLIDLLTEVWQDERREIYRLRVSEALTEFLRSRAQSRLPDAAIFGGFSEMSTVDHGHEKTELAEGGNNRVLRFL